MKNHASVFEGTLNMRLILSVTAALLFGFAAPLHGIEPVGPLGAQRLYGPFHGGRALGYGYGRPAALPVAAAPPGIVVAGPAWTFRNPLYSGLMAPRPYSALYPPYGTGLYGVSYYPTYFRTYRPMWAIPLQRPWGYGYGYGLGYGFGYGSAWGFPGAWPYGSGPAMPPPLPASQFSVLGAYGLRYGCPW